MIYRDWVKTNTGIFYQINRVQTLPFAKDTLTIENIDQDFLLENANKEMFSSDTEKIVNSILASLLPKWIDLYSFYSTIEPGYIKETTTTCNNKSQKENHLALNDSEDMFTTNANDLDVTTEATTKTRNVFEYTRFLLSSGLYDIIKKELRNYLFVNVY